MRAGRRPDGGGVRPVLLVALALGLVAAVVVLLLSEAPERPAPALDGSQLVGPVLSGGDGEAGLPPAWVPPSPQPEPLQPPTGTGGAPLVLGTAFRTGVVDPRFPVVPEQFFGRVVDPFGRPLAGAQVYFLPGHATFHALGYDIWWAHQLAPGDLPVTTTGADGRFELEGPHSPRCSDGLQMGDFWAVEPALVVVAEDFARHPHNLTGYRSGAYDAGDLRVEHEGRVTGRLVDAAGRPLAGVDVVAITEDVQPAQLPPGAVRVEDDLLEIFLRDRSDAEGRFELRGLWNGAATLQFRGDEVAPLDHDDVRITGGQVTDVGTLVLQGGRYLVGRVVDQHGRPVPGAEVCAVDDDSLDIGLDADTAASVAAAFTHAFVRRGTLTEDGHFRVTRLQDRKIYNLFARAPGREPRLIRMVQVGDDQHEFVLPPADDLGVAVVDAKTDRRRPDATVHAWRWAQDDSRLGLVLPVTPSAASGPVTQHITHQVKGVGSGRHTLLGVAPGRGVMLRHFDALAENRTENQTEGVRFELFAGGVVSGRVVDTSGAPVAGARISTSVDVGPELPGLELLLPRTLSDDDGRYELERLGPMTWGLYAEAAGYVPSPWRLVTMGNHDLEHDFTLMRAAGVSGTLYTRAGTPAAGQDLALWRLGQEERDRVYEGSTTSNQRGEYAFEGLEPGRYRAVWRRAVEATLAEGQQLRLDIHEADRPILSGTVWYQGNLLQSGSVKLRRVADEFGGRANEHSAAAVNAGRYEIHLSSPGRYLVVAADASSRACSSVFELQLDWDEQRGLDLVVGGVGVSGRVVSAATGKPLPNATVTALHDSDELLLMSVRSDAAGRFRFAELGAGPVRLQVRAEAHEQFRGETFAVPAGSELDVGDLVLPGRGLVRITVDRSQSGAGQPKLTLLLVDLDQRRLIHTLVGRGQGSFNMAAPHAGRYGVLALDGHQRRRDDTVVWHPDLVPVDVELGVVAQVRVALSAD